MPRKSVRLDVVSDSMYNHVTYKLLYIYNNHGLDFREKIPLIVISE
jgi:hypothetical protein